MSSPAVAHRRHWRAWAPFGLGQVKPTHFRDRTKIVWENRDNLGYAWKVISKGVCDGCALAVAGLHDWTVKGPHLCMTQLNLLRMWPEGNTLIRRGVVDQGGGVPDYNARVRIEVLS